MKSVDEAPAQRNVKGDVQWNMASFAVIAGIGVLLNVLILKFFSSSALGVYAQVHSIHLIASQFATGGFHLSIQSYAPRYHYHRHLSVVLRSAMLITTLQSLLVVMVLYLLNGVIANILDSEPVGRAMLLVLPGLFFFSLNKVLFGFLNGLRFMKVFAILKALRLVFMLSSLLVLYMLDMPGEYIISIISVTEVLLFIILMLRFSRYLIAGGWGRNFKSWLAIHWRHGKKALVGNIILDVNAYVDVLMLGYFLSDSLVGVYSFASTLSEGVRQVNEVFRNNLNPILTQVYFSPRRKILQRITGRSVRVFYKFLVGACVLSLIGFPILLWMFQMDDPGHEMFIVFIILVAGIALASGYLPLKMIFNQVGMASQQTRLFLWHFLVNLVLNAVLIPFFGIYGAAAATSLAMVAQVFILKGMVKKHLSIHI